VLEGHDETPTAAAPPATAEPWRAVGLLLCILSVAALGHGHRRAADPPPPTERRAAPSPEVSRAAGALRDGRSIDVNAASPEALRLLPGIGPALAERIVAERRRGGPFRSLRDLQRVRGIGPRKAARLAGWLRFGAGSEQRTERGGASGGAPVHSADVRREASSERQSRLRRKAPRP